jgi:hypothetical protein
MLEPSTPVDLNDDRADVVVAHVRVQLRGDRRANGSADFDGLEWPDHEHDAAFDSAAHNPTPTARRARDVRSAPLMKQPSSRTVSTARARKRPELEARRLG